MKSDIKQTGTLSGGIPVGRAKRRVNGMADRAGLPDPPARGRWTRTVALLDAALRVWEANQPAHPTVWRQKPQ